MRSEVAARVKLAEADSAPNLHAVRMTRVFKQDESSPNKHKQTTNQTNNSFFTHTHTHLGLEELDVVVAALGRGGLVHSAEVDEL